MTLRRPGVGCAPVDKTCDLQVDAGVDCGRPAVYVVRASPGIGELKPFYACPEHPQTLYTDLVGMGWRVQEPTTI